MDEEIFGPWSSISFTTGGETIVLDEPMPSISMITHNRATVDWPDVDDADIYLIQLSLSQFITLPEEFERTSSSIVLRNLEPDTTYYVRVTANASLSEGIYEFSSDSDVVSFTTDEAPITPTNRSVIAEFTATVPDPNEVSVIFTTDPPRDPREIAVDFTTRARAKRSVGVAFHVTPEIVIPPLLSPTTNSVSVQMRSVPLSKPVSINFAIIEPEPRQVFMDFLGMVEEIPMETAPATGFDLIISASPNRLYRVNPNNINDRSGGYGRISLSGYDLEDFNGVGSRSTWNTAYVINDDGDNDNLVRINLLTGEATLVAAFLSVDTSGEIDVNAAGELVVSNLYGSNDRGRIYRFNRTTGSRISSSSFADFGQEFGIVIGGIGVHPTNGLYYGAHTFRRRLYRWNPANLSSSSSPARSIGALPGNAFVRAMAMYPSAIGGTQFAIIADRNSRRLYRINVDNPSSFASLGSPSGVSGGIDGMTFARSLPRDRLGRPTLSISNITEKSATLNIIRPVGTASYEIEVRSFIPGTDPEVEITSTENVVELTDLLPGVTHRVSVKAIARDSDVLDSRTRTIDFDTLAPREVEVAMTMETQLEPALTIIFSRISDSEVNITWIPIPLAEFVFYDFGYTDAMGFLQRIESRGQVPNGSIQSLHFDNLDADTRHVIQMTFSRSGFAARSGFETFRTSLTPPRLVTTEFSTETLPRRISVELRASPPPAPVIIRFTAQEAAEEVTVLFTTNPSPRPVNLALSATPSPRPVISQFTASPLPRPVSLFVFVVPAPPRAVSVDLSVTPLEREVSLVMTNGAPPFGLVLDRSFNLFAFPLNNPASVQAPWGLLGQISEEAADQFRPLGMAFDSDHRLIVIDAGTFEDLAAWDFNNLDNTELPFGPLGRIPRGGQEGFESPQSLGRIAPGEMLSTDNAADNLWWLSVNETEFEGGRFGNKGPLPTPLRTPRGLDVDNLGDAIIINDINVADIWRINPNNPSDESGRFGRIDRLPNPLNDPHGISIDANNDAWVVTNSGDVWRINLNSPRQDFGGYGLQGRVPGVDRARAIAVLPLRPDPRRVEFVFDTGELQPRPVSLELNVTPAPPRPVILAWLSMFAESVELSFISTPAPRQVISEFAATSAPRAVSGVFISRPEPRTVELDLMASPLPRPVAVIFDPGQLQPRPVTLSVSGGILQPRFVQVRARAMRGPRTVELTASYTPAPRSVEVIASARRGFKVVDLAFSAQKGPDPVVLLMRATEPGQLAPPVITASQIAQLSMRLAFDSENAESFTVVIVSLATGQVVLNQELPFASFPIEGFNPETEYEITGTAHAPGFEDSFPSSIQVKTLRFPQLVIARFTADAPRRVRIGYQADPAPRAIELSFRAVPVRVVEMGWFSLMAVSRPAYILFRVSISTPDLPRHVDFRMRSLTSVPRPTHISFVSIPPDPPRLVRILMRVTVDLPRAVTIGFRIALRPVWVTLRAFPPAPRPVSLALLGHHITPRAVDVRLTTAARRAVEVVFSAGRTVEIVFSTRMARTVSVTMDAAVQGSRGSSVIFSAAPSRMLPVPLVADLVPPHLEDLPVPVIQSGTKTHIHLGEGNPLMAVLAGGSNRQIFLAHTDGRFGSSGPFSSPLDALNAGAMFRIYLSSSVRNGPDVLVGAHGTGQLAVVRHTGGGIQVDGGGFQRNFRYDECLYFEIEMFRALSPGTGIGFFIRFYDYDERRILEAGEADTGELVSPPDFLLDMTLSLSMLVQAPRSPSFSIINRVELWASAGRAWADLIYYIGPFGTEAGRGLPGPTMHPYGDTDVEIINSRDSAISQSPPSIPTFSATVFDEHEYLTELLQADRWPLHLTMTRCSVIFENDGWYEAPFTGVLNTPRYLHQSTHKWVGLSAIGMSTLLTQNSRLNHPSLFGPADEMTAGKIIVEAASHYASVNGIVLSDLLQDSTAIIEEDFPMPVAFWWMSGENLWSVFHRAVATQGPPATFWENGLGRVKFWSGRRSRPLPILVGGPVLGQPGIEPIVEGDIIITDHVGDIANDALIPVQAKGYVDSLNLVYSGIDGARPHISDFYNYSPIAEDLGEQIATHVHADGTVATNYVPTAVPMPVPHPDEGQARETDEDRYAYENEPLPVPVPGARSRLDEYTPEEILNGDNLEPIVLWTNTAEYALHERAGEQRMIDPGDTVRYLFTNGEPFKREDILIFPQGFSSDLEQPQITPVFQYQVDLLRLSATDLEITISHTSGNARPIPRIALVGVSLKSLGVVNYLTSQRVRGDARTVASRIIYRYRRFEYQGYSSIYPQNADQLADWAVEYYRDGIKTIEMASYVQGLGDQFRDVMRFTPTVPIDLYHPDYYPDHGRFNMLIRSVTHRISGRHHHVVLTLDEDPERRSANPVGKSPLALL